jgi:glutamate/tyrosine decarboxylase-like PLP-dependent enzyme
MDLQINKEQREKIWQYIQKRIETHRSGIINQRVSPILDKPSVRKLLESQPFDKVMDPVEAIELVLSGLENHLVHTSHPHYMGLFNPRSNFASIIGDLITAAYNPQMATWSHAPFPIECEQYVVEQLGKKLGYEDYCDGVFTSGGAEANLTAVTCALNYVFPEVKKAGLKSLNANPVLYCSTEAHHSVARAAIVTGLGANSVRNIPTNSVLQMDMDILEQTIKTDISNGFDPFCIIGTAGTTGAGAIDDLNTIRLISDTYGLWMHTDAAYGGALCLTKQYNYLLKEIEASDSITLDAHKWLSVPMGAGIFLTRHNQILSQTFGISTDYMPKEGKALNNIDPYTHSIQWSRRFIGLKLYLSLLIYGWEGYDKSISDDIRIGKYLKELLIADGWKIYNNTELPIVCFGMASWESSRDQVFNVVEDIVAQGQMWLSSFKIKNVNTIRACITNYETRDKEIETIVSLLRAFQKQ